MRLLIALAAFAGVGLLQASGALAASPTEPPAGSGSIGIRLLDVPAGSHGDPLARSYIVERVLPGAIIHRRIEISNSTGSTADVAVYAAAATLRGGKFGFAAGHGQDELSSWTSVSRPMLHLSPRTRSSETVAIKAPADASPGEHYAVIWAEVSAPSGAAGGVTLVNRVGIRMYLSVGPGGAAAPNFAIGSLTAKRSTAGELLVLATIHNTGGRTLSISGNLTLSQGPSGLRAGPLPVTLETALAPGASEPAIVRLDRRLPRGPWHARLQLRSGLIERATEATIELPGRATPTQSPTARAAPAVSNRLILLAGAFLVLLAAAGAAGLLLVRRRA